MNALRPYLTLLAGQWPRLLLGAGLILATTAAAVGLLALSGWFITATAMAAAGAVAVVAFDIYVPGAGIRFFALARTVARYAERLHNHDMVLRFLAVLRRQMFAGLTRLDAATLGRLRSAELLNRLSADVDALEELSLRGLLPPLVALLAVLALAAALATLHPWLGLAAGVWLLGAMAVLGLAAWYRAGTASRASVAALGGLRTRILDLLEGLAEHRAFGSLAGQQRRIQTDQTMLTGHQRRMEQAAARGDAGMEWAVQMAVASVLVAALILHAKGEVGGASAALAAFAVLGIAELLAGLPGAFARLGRSQAAAQRLNELRALAPAVPPPRSPRRPPEAGALHFERLCFRHGPAQPWVFRGVDLSVAQGERLAVTGRSGSGKSTLGALAARLHDPVAGRVLYGGLDLREADPAVLRRRIGYLTQHTELFDDSVAWNLRIAAPHAGEGALWRALEIVGLAGLVERLPHGLYSRVGESGGLLSGGQGRRLALARLVLLEPAVVVLDEPLRGIDARTADEIRATLGDWLAGRTVLLLGHDVAKLPAADRVIDIERDLPGRPAGWAQGTETD